MSGKEHPLWEPFVAPRIAGFRWLIITALSAGLLQLLGRLAGFQSVGTWVLASAGVRSGEKGNRTVRGHG